MKRTKYKSARPGVVNSLPQKLAIYAVLILGSMAMLLPFAEIPEDSFGTVVRCTSPAGDVFLLPIRWIPPNPTLENFQRVFTEFEFQHYIWNTVWLTAINMVGFMLSCALVAYGFATQRFKYKNVLFMLVLATMMLLGLAAWRGSGSR
mgnify:CR=1 FL=1